MRTRWRRRGFATRLLLAQLLVIVAGGATLALVALSIAPGIFHSHVRQAVGTLPSPVRDHLDLAEASGWIDVARGTKVSGSRFAYRVADVALLELALYRFALQRVVGRGHIPMLPPVLVRKEAMYGTGFFPTDAINIYEIERDELYLVGTSEVPLAAFHGGEVLDELPLRYVAHSTCFRREAGAAGKDTRGMFRVH